MDNFKIWDVVYYTNGNIPIFWKAKIKEIIYDDTNKVSSYKLDINDVFWKPVYFSPSSIMGGQYFPKSKKKELISKFLKNSATSQLQNSTNYYFLHTANEFGKAELVSYKRIASNKGDEYIAHFRFWIKEFDFKWTLQELNNKYLTEDKIISQINKF